MNVMIKTDFESNDKRNYIWLSQTTTIIESEIIMTVE